MPPDASSCLSLHHDKAEIANAFRVRRAAQALEQHAPGLLSDCARAHLDRCQCRIEHRQHKRTAHLVNLGFVINVIENLDERIEALRGAFALAEEMLVVSAMLTNQDVVRGTAYGDGVLTSRNTFQKYYSQGELRQFIAEVLHEEPLPVGPGIFYVFKDKDAEQRFMYGRLENRRNILRLSRLSRPEKAPRVDRAQAKYEQHKEILENLWESCLALGRDPDRIEVSNIVAVTESFGSLPAALRFIKSLKDDAIEILERSHQSRIADLQVYFAQLQFEKRKPYRQLEARLQKDVKSAALSVRLHRCPAIGRLGAVRAPRGAVPGTSVRCCEAADPHPANAQTGL